ncbi:MAG TPA: hypothetical protein VGD45_03485 [Steroidobacter sp.]|uniref:hypothetical protein n=1 Tax=Steroidobacter sp. TaxID=1978227 RepID=UPI002EDB29EE
MRKFLWLVAAFAALAGCNDGKIAGDDPTRNNEGPGEGRPMDSSPSVRERSQDPRPDQERAYAEDKSTEQTTAAPPDPDQ